MGTQAKSFRFIEDPGHGWLEVSLQDLKEAKVGVHQISGYSYINGDMVYLEEDCDAAVFLNALADKTGKEVGEVIRERTTSIHQDPCFIRDLKRLHS